MNITSELMEQVKNAETPEELQKIAKENDAEISLEDAQMIFNIIKKK